MKTKLEVSNYSYEDVIIKTDIKDTVIYLDPPYSNTMKYQHDIDIENLYNWIDKQGCPVYMSSYESDKLDCVLEIDHTKKYSSAGNSKVIEKLFSNKEPNKKTKKDNEINFDEW